MVNIFRAQPTLPEENDPPHLQQNTTTPTDFSEKKVVEGMNYALCIIGSIIGQAVETGSTPVLQVWRVGVSKLGVVTLSQGPTFKPLGITYLVGKTSRSNGFISGSEMAK